MNAEKRENNDESGSSDVEGADSGAERSPSPTAPTIPKKRGRPAKPGKKVEKKPSGRGRGRPAKTEEDGATENGATEKVKSTAGRGRPPKAGKVKPLTQVIPPSTKGRGRPKNANKRAAEDDDDEEDDDEEEIHEVSPKKAVKEVAKRQGRPRKPVQQSEDEASDNDQMVEDEEDEKELNRSGANSNAARSGRAVGRPKKVGTEKKRTVETAEFPKKRGRPSKKPAGKVGRGRPTVVHNSSDEEDTESKEDEEFVDEPLHETSNVEDSAEDDAEFVDMEKKHRNEIPGDLAAA